MKAITAVFQDEKRASEVIEALGAAGVPEDQIDLTVVDRGGAHPVPVRQNNRVLKPATVICAGIGAVLGGVIAAVAMNSGISDASMAVLLGDDPLLGTVRGVLMGTGAGFAVGVLGFLDFWRSEPAAPEEALEEGAVVVSVRSDELHNTARQVFQEQGARRISG